MGKTCLIHVLSSLALTCQLFLFFQVSRATSSIALGSLISTQNIDWPLGATSNIVTSSAGDFNGDGFEDIILSMQRYNSNSYSYSGTVYIIFGAATNFLNINLNTLNAAQGIRISGRQDDWLSASVNSLGDINQDGVDDIILGADNTRTAFVLFGSKNGLSNINLPSGLGPTQGIKIVGLASNRLGLQVSSAGDFNGDGKNDFMVSAPEANSGQGIVYIIFGKSPFSSDIDVSSLALPIGIQIKGSTGDQIGLSLSKAGDVNKDGIDDILIGTDKSSCPSSTDICGKVVVIYGTKTPVSPIQIDSLDVSQGIKIIGLNGAAIGSAGSISSAGDVNNDGVDDIAIGAPGFSPASATAGAGQAFILYGKDGGFTGDIDLSKPFDGFQITGNIPNGAFGRAIIAGDINKDGLLDLIVGSKDISGSTGTNIIYFFFGNKNGLYDMDLSSPDSQLPLVLKITGDGSSAFINSRLAIAKDFNKDNASDIIIAGSLKTYALYGSVCEDTTQCSSSTISPICYVSKGCLCGENGQLYHKNKCVSQCPDGYYPNQGFCESCPSSCSTCTSLSICQTCSDGYKLKENSCELACPVGYHLVESICQSEDVSSLKKIESIQAVTKVTGPVASGTLAAAGVLASNDPGSGTSSSLAKMLQYVKYLNVSYSQSLELTFQYHNSTYGPYGIGPRMPSDLIMQIPFHPIPSRFLRFHVHSSFLINFWDSMIFLAIIYTVLSLVAPIEWGLNRIKKKAVPFARMMRAAIQCFSLMQFYNVFGDILMFAVLEAKTLNLINFETKLSFGLSIFFLLVGCIILGTHIYILIRFSKLRRNPLWQSEIEDFFKRYEGSGVLFKHFRDNTFASQSFLLIFVLRSCLFNLILAFLYEQPTIQISLILTMNAMMLVYLIVQRPFKTIVNLLQHIACEILLLIVNISVLMMVQLNFEKQDAYEHRDEICEVIIYTGLILTYVPQVFLLIKVIVALIEWHMSKKKSSQKEVKTGRIVKLRERLQNENPKFITYQNRALNESSIEISMVHNISGLNQSYNNSSVIEYPFKGSNPLHKKERESKDYKAKNSPRKQQLDSPINSFRRIKKRDHQKLQRQENSSKVQGNNEFHDFQEEGKQIKSPRFRSVLEKNSIKKILFNKRDL